MQRSEPVCSVVFWPSIHGQSLSLIHILNAEGKDEFTFPEGMPVVQQYKQFGNSVTIPVIEEMARFMLDCLAILRGEEP